MLFKSKDQFLKIFDSLSSFKVIGIDYGRVKTGLAVYNSEVKMSLHTVMIKDIKNNFVDYMNFHKLHQPNAIVVGLPLQKNGSLPNNYLEIKGFCELLIKKTSLPLFLSDERYTTSLANTLLKQTDKSRRQRSALDDRLSASLILENLFRWR